MKSVFILWHVSPDNDDEKLIGVYQSEIEARSAIKRLESQPGFQNEPEGFSVDEYELNKDHWTEGFARVD